MTTARWLATTLAFAMAGCATAQPSPPDTPCASASGAGGPMHGCGPGPHARWGSDYTPGWPMMSSDERQAHRDRMGTFKGYPECRAYVDSHHGQMQARAKERGVAMPGQPMHDACGPLQGTPKP